MTFLVILIGSVAALALLHAIGAGDGHDTGGGDHDGGISSEVINIRNLLIFGVGFGGAGFIAQRLDQSPYASSVWGLGFGCIMVLVSVMFYRSVRRQQSNSLVDHNSIVGKTASVTTSIPETGLGEIQTTNQFGSTLTMSAKSVDGLHPAGATVTITGTVGNIATVKTA